MAASALATAGSACGPDVAHEVFNASPRHDANVSYTSVLSNASASPNGSGGGEEGGLSAEDQQLLMTMWFFMFGVLGDVLVVLGLLGNTLSIVVLCNRRMRSSTSYYLTSLAVYDNFVLVSMLLFFNLPALGGWLPAIMAVYNGYVVPVIPVAYPLSLTAQMGSIYTCVAFTVERFVAVCRPLHAGHMCTKSRAKRAILVIVLWSMLYNIPRCFHYETYTVCNDETRQHENRVRPTEFGRNVLFQHIYTISLQLTFMFLLPFVVILLLNAALLRAINRSRNQRQQMSTTATREHNLTVMLVAVIVVFLVCQFPTIVDNILVAIVGEERHDGVVQYQLLYIFSTTLVTINSSLNFALYCLFGKKFRMVLCHILGLQGGGQKENQYRSTIYQSRANGTKVSHCDMEVSLV